MNHRTLSACLAAALLVAAPCAQAQRAAAASQPDPLDARAEVPPASHDAAFASYRAAGEVEVGSWREANDAVTRIGGWRAYAREASRPGSAAPGAAVRATPGAPGQAAPGAPAQTPPCMPMQPAPCTSVQPEPGAPAHSMPGDSNRRDSIRGDSTRGDPERGDLKRGDPMRGVAKRGVAKRGDSTPGHGAHRGASQ